MSGKRKEILATNEIYHTFNRTVGNEEIFIRSSEIKRILELADYYRFNPNLSFSKYKDLASEERKNHLTNVKKLPKIVEIYVFAFMPNHFHFIIKQLEEEGIKTFLSNIQNGFAKYFNIKNNRSGTLFQKAFKAKRISNDEIFLHLSRYIHLNPVTSYLIKPAELSSYPLTSYIHYFGDKKGDLVNTEFLLKIIGSKKNYDKFVMNQVDYQRKLQKIKRVLLE